MPQPTRPLGPAPTILIVRLSSLREVIHGLPVLSALRRHYPAARIAWVVEQPFAPVLEGHAALDRAIPTPRGWLTSPAAVLRLRQELRRERFDVAIDLQGLTKSGVAARLSGAPWRIGVAGRDGRELSRLFHNDRVPVRAWHAIDHYLGLLRPLGIHDPAVDHRLPSWPRAAVAIDRFLRNRRLTPGGFALMHPAAGRSSEAWPAEHYAALAQQLGEHLHLPSVATWTGTAERELARGLVAQTGGWSHLSPATSLHELAELARRAAIVVGSDSAELHLAVAAGAATISLHGPTRASRTGAYGGSNLRLQAFHDARPAGRRGRDAESLALQALSPETVYTACARLLHTSRPAQTHRPLAAA